jgi:hypothetical protein
VSYDLKYRSDFYNVFGTKVIVKIYKKDYGSHSVINLRTVEVSLEVNNQDEPVVGTGLRVVIVNEGEFNSLNDLLTSREKEFECIVYYGNYTVFDGYSICDLNEQQFAPFAKITLQFTDYLRRLEGSFAPCLTPVGGTCDILSILQEAMIAIGKTCNFNVNSSLFETRMNKTANDTFLEQTYVENLMFYSDANSYDSYYAALNKVLKSFNAVFYSMGDKWVLERYDDITRPPSTQTWVTFANPLNSEVQTGVADANLRQVYNKQAGDFSYTELSQIVEYDSGLQKLILKLNDKQLDTFVFNDYKTDGFLATTDQYPNYSILLLKKWYIFNTNIVIKTGLIFRSMTNYVEWKYDLTYIDDFFTDNTYEFNGLYYHFKLTFNTPENYVVNPLFNPASPTQLIISFKQSLGNVHLTPIEIIVIRYCIMVGNWFLTELEDQGKNKFWGLTSTPTPIRNEFSVSGLLNENIENSISLNIDLTTSITGFGGEYIPSIWTQLGQPKSIDAVVMFFPISIYTTRSSQIRTANDNFLGDIQVGVASQKIPNKLTYYINEIFVNTETDEMDFFDLVNDNFANGPRIMPGSPPEGVKTETWSTYQHPIAAPLMDIYARVKFGNYCHTLHKLKGTIISDNYIKPFAILTDDNLKDDNGVNIELILHHYTWDLNNGTYDIEADEFTEEVLGVSVDSSGTPSSESGTIEPYTLSVSPSTLNWVWNDLSTQTFVVTTNMPQWYLSQEYNPYDPINLFSWYVYDETNTVLITSGLYTSGMIVRVTPLANNSGTTNKVIIISIPNESNEIMPNGTVIGTQTFLNSDNPPTVTPSISDASFTLSYFESMLATSNSNLTIWWTPTGCVLSDFDIYIIVQRSGLTVATAMFPHNFNDIQHAMVIPLSEAAIAGATYDVIFSTGINN